MGLNMRMLHTMLRVGNLDASKRFYCDVLGMKVLREREYTDGKFTLCFVGYGDEATSTVIELTYNWGVSKYDLGNGYGHIALGTEDIVATCDRARAAGATIAREPGPMKFGTTVIDFIEDPDGYRIELIEKTEHKERA